MHGLIQRSVSITAALVLVMAITGCTTKHVGPTAGRDLVGVDESWATAAAAGDVEAVMEFWTEHAVLYAPNLPPLYGKQAIRELIQKRHGDPGYHVGWTPSCAGVDDCGAMAYTLGSGTVSLPDDSGVRRELGGRYVAIWQKEDGRWKCAVKCWTPSPD